MWAQTFDMDGIQGQPEHGLISRQQGIESLQTTHPLLQHL